METPDRPMAFDLSRRRMTLLYDEDCGVCTAFAQRLQRASGGRIVIKGAQLDDSMIVECDGRQSTHADAIATLSRAFPAPVQVLRVAAWPGVRILTNAGYRLFAKHRHRVSALLGLGTCRRGVGSGTPADGQKTGVSA